MSAHVILNLLNELVKRDKMRNVARTKLAIKSRANCQYSCCLPIYDNCNNQAYKITLFEL